MKEFDEILNLWKEQNENKLDVNLVMTNINKTRNKMALKLFIGVLCMLLSIVVMIIVWVKIDFKELTTYIGLSIVIFFVFMYTLWMIRHTLRLKNLNTLLDPIQSLEQLKDIKKEQIKMNSFYMNIYFIALALGMLLYFNEVLEYASLKFKLGAYGLTFGWMLFVYFVLSKRSRKKTNAKMDAMIESLERIQNQLK